MLTKRMCAAVLAAALCCVAARASAANLEIANAFNGFIFGNATAANADTEGRLAVGGNFSATSYGVGNMLTNSNGTRDDLVVGGTLNASGGWEVFNGNAVYGVGVTQTPNTPNGTTFQGTPVNFAAAQADLLAKSAYWATLPATGTANLVSTTLTMNGANPVLNVFSVTESDWEGSNSKQLNIPVGSTALINIAGTSISQTGGMAINGNGNATGNPAMPGVLYHYPDATSLTIQFMQTLGSVLAPKAHLVLQSANINGIGVAASSQQIDGGEFHHYPFNGDLPNVPEPTSVMLLVSAACGVVGLRRR